MRGSVVVRRVTSTNPFCLLMQLSQDLPGQLSDEEGLAMLTLVSLEIGERSPINVRPKDEIKSGSRVPNKLFMIAPGMERPKPMLLYAGHDSFHHRRL